MRRWVIVGVVALLVVVVAGLFAYRWMQRGMYEVGQARVVRARDAAPPSLGADGVVTVADGVKLHHQVVGEGRPVLFLHGGPAMPARDPWPAAETLGKAMRIHFYDQRGSGRSTRPIDRVTESNTFAAMQRIESTLGFAQQVADADRVREAVGVERLVVIGHSFGGLLAALYAAEFPERVEALILVAPANLVRMPVEGEEDLFALVRERLPEARRSAFDAYMARYFDMGALLKLDEAALSAHYGDFAKFYLEAGSALPVGEAAGPVGGFATYASYLSLGMRHDYAAALARVNIPVLVVHGKQDLASPRQSDAFAAFFPRAEPVDLERSGHFPFLDQPEEFTRVVLDFLGRQNLLARSDQRPVASGH